MPNSAKITKDDSCNSRDNHWIFISMLIGAICSLTAAFNLSLELLQLAANSNANLVCNINSVINCGLVAKTSFASTFGFPNSFLGMMVEPIIITVAVAGLSGVKFPRPFMFAAQICYFLGFLFAYYLFFAGIFIIHALCPWCLIVTLATTFVLFSITRYNIREDNLYLSDKLSKIAHRFISKDYDKLVLALLVVFVISMVVVRYGGSLIA